MLTIVVINKQAKNMIKIQDQSPCYKFIELIHKGQQSSVESEQYVPKKYIRRKSIRNKSKDPNFNHSFWKQEEKTAYMEFLIANQSLFMQNNTTHRLVKINVLMSQAIKTRSSTQCRSHHQKMMKFYGNIPTIVEYIKGLRTIDRYSHAVQANFLIKIQQKQEKNDS